MSTILKGNTSTKGRSAAPQNESSGTAKQNNDGVKGNVPKLRAPLTVPEIPGFMKKLLNDKDRPIKELRGINVTFFPNNLSEVKYIVGEEISPGEYGERELTATQFMKLQEQYAQKRRTEHEVLTYEGLAEKYRKRLLIVITGEVSLERGRAITAKRLPPTAKGILSLSQKEFAEKFVNEEAVVSFWEKSQDSTIRSMNELQADLDKTVNWSDTLFGARKLITEQHAARAARELEKSKRRAEMVMNPVGPLVPSHETWDGSGPGQGRADVVPGKGSWADSEDKDVEERRKAVLLKYTQMPPDSQKQVNIDILTNPECYKTQENTDEVLLSLDKIINGGENLK